MHNINIKITSNVPESCPDCGEDWSAGETIKTGDEDAYEGYEDWRHCNHCGCELFYPHKIDTNE